MGKTRHGGIPLKRTATGVGFDLQSQAKGIRAEFEDLRRKTAQYKANIYVIVEAMRLGAMRGDPPTVEQLAQLAELVKP